MCYFIHLKVIEEGKASYAKKFIESLSGNEIKIKGKYPNFTLTDGICSCDFIQNNGKKINISDGFFKNILSEKSIKNIFVNWNWGEQHPAARNRVRMDVAEFLEKNNNAELQTDYWYQLYDLSKYS